MLKLLILYDSDVDISYINTMSKGLPLSIFTKIETFEVPKPEYEFITMEEVDRYNYKKITNDEDHHRLKHEYIMKEADDVVRVNSLRNRLEHLVLYYSKLGYYFTYVVNYKMSKETYYYKKVKSKFKTKRKKLITQMSKEKKPRTKEIKRLKQENDLADDYIYDKKLKNLRVFASFFNRNVVLSIMDLSPDQARKVFLHEWSHLVFSPKMSHLDKEGHCTNNSIDISGKETTSNCLMSALVDTGSIDIANGFCGSCHTVLLEEELHPEQDKFAFLLD